MKLLCEVFDVPLQILTEERDGKQIKFFEGVFLQAGLKNRNGRIYPVDIMEREVQKYTESHINTKRSWGELNHPPTPAINLERVSHLVTELRRDGNNWIGKAQITETPMGHIVRGLVEAGSIGTSSRGLGSLTKKSDANWVNTDFQLMVAGDVVGDPSAPDAWLNPMMENAEWIQDIKTGSWKLAEEIENIQKEIHNTPKALIGERAVAAFQKFISKINNS